MNSITNNLNQQQCDYLQNDQIELAEPERTSMRLNSEIRMNDIQVSDAQPPTFDTNHFAMDVNLNSFEGFSQIENHTESGIKETSVDEQSQQNPHLFRGRQFRGSEDQEEKDILNKIFVGGIHPDTSEASLKEHFANYGSIIDHVIIKDPTTKRSRGFGFVKYTESSAVDEVCFNEPLEF